MRHPLFPVLSRASVSRRSFLGSVSLAAAAAWSSRAVGAVPRKLAVPDYPFQLGVASGDPTSTGFVLWTRLAPKPLEGGGMPTTPVAVDWEIADDEGMTKIVKKGETIASPDWGHSVHVEVDGLQPDRWYWYRFRAAGEISPVGRTRTFPARDREADKLRLAFASCQHYETGFYTAYGHMLREELDVVAHLGDYIYEGGPRAGRVRKHNSHEIVSLDDYRNRYGLYKSDPALAAVHAAFPWIVTWDDHEVDNNYADAISEEDGVVPADFLKRRAAAYQAYYEHMPLRRTNIPHGPDMPIYRRVSFGTLAEFFVLDTRQYRTDQPCGDGTKVPCEAVFDPESTILGQEQKEWLLAGLATSKSQWNVMTQQVLMAKVARKMGDTLEYSMDKWAAYETDRRDVLKCFEEKRVSNPVVLTGDIHSNWANDLVIDWDDSEPRTVGAEFVGTSISSSGNGTAKPKGLAEMMSAHPFVKFHNQQRGYVRCEVTPDAWRTDYRVVEYVEREGAPITTKASFVAESGRMGLQEA